MPYRATLSHSRQGPRASLSRWRPAAPARADWRRGPGIRGGGVGARPGRSCHLVLSAIPPLTRTVVLVRNAQWRQAGARPSRRPMSRRGSAKAARTVASWPAKPRLPAPGPRNHFSSSHMDQLGHRGVGACSAPGGSRAYRGPRCRPQGTAALVLGQPRFAGAAGRPCHPDAWLEVVRHGVRPCPVTPPGLYEARAPVDAPEDRREHVAAVVRRIACPLPWPPEPEGAQDLMSRSRRGRDAVATMMQHLHHG